MKRSRGILLILFGMGCAPAPSDAGGTLAGAPSGAPSRATPGGESRAAAAPDTLTTIESDLLLQDLGVLAHDSMEGRRTGTPGIERARRFLEAEFPRRGLEPVLASLGSGPAAVGSGPTIQEFMAGPGDLSVAGDPSTAGASVIPVVTGANVLGMVEGTTFPRRYIVVTAHYDHLGVRGGQVYNGADDNASGTAALLALASHFSRNPPRHSLLFVAFDAEEMGLRGAREFVSNPPVPVDSIVLNVNLDMVSRSAAGELYAAGTYHYPFLTELVGEVAERSAVTLLTGHDRPGLPPGDDWTDASDHGPFHEAGIPFLYFGVEDHEGYHEPTDDPDDITPEFYVNAVETVLDFIRMVDGEGEEILARRAPRLGP